MVDLQADQVPLRQHCGSSVVDRDLCSRSIGWRIGRINVDHRVTGGVPCIVATRIPVATIVSLVVDDVRAALEYAAATVRERELPLRTGV